MTDGYVDWPGLQSRLAAIVFTYITPYTALQGSQSLPEL